MQNPSITLTSKGQLTLPVIVRKALKLETGDKFEVITMDNGYLQLRKRSGSAVSIAGLLSHLQPDPAYPTDEDAIMAEIESRSHNKSVKP